MTGPFRHIIYAVGNTLFGLPGFPRLAPPARADEWEVRFGTDEAAKGRDELCRQAATNTRWAWELMRLEPAPRSTTARHHRLKGALPTACTMAVD